MIRQVTEGIAAALYEEFGSGCAVYTEAVEQDLKPPCFLITCAGPKKTLFLDRRCLADLLFLVQYFPESRAEPERECMDALERLWEALEYVRAGGRLLRVSDMEGETADGVLHTKVQYRFFTVKAEEEEPLMKTLTQETEVKP